MSAAAKPACCLALIADPLRRGWVRVARVEIVEHWAGLGAMVRDPRDRITYVMPESRLASRKTVALKLRAVIRSEIVCRSAVAGRSAPSKVAGDGSGRRTSRGFPAWYRGGQYA